MTFVGKLLVVVQMVMAICFMAFAGAVFTAETNWREKAVASDKAAKDAQQELTSKENAFRQETEGLQGTISKLEGDVALRDSEVTKLTGELKRTQQEANEAQTEVDRSTAAMALAAEQAKFREEETGRLRDTNQRLQEQINELLAKNRELEDNVFGLNRLIASMTEKNEKNIKQIDIYRKMILLLGGSLKPEDYQNLAAQMPPPPNVEGKVISSQVNEASGVEYVEISLGKDDGFKPGDTLEIFRGAEYLGKLKLSSLEADSAVGTVVPGTRNRNGKIQKDDNVKPKL